MHASIDLILYTGKRVMKNDIGVPRDGTESPRIIFSLSLPPPLSHFPTFLSLFFFL